MKTIQLTIKELKLLKACLKVAKYVAKPEEIEEIGKLLDTIKLQEVKEI